MRELFTDILENPPTKRYVELDDESFESLFKDFQRGCVVHDLLLDIVNDEVSFESNVILLDMMLDEMGESFESDVIKDKAEELKRHGKVVQDSKDKMRALKSEKSDSKEDNKDKRSRITDAKRKASDFINKHKGKVTNTLEKMKGWIEKKWKVLSEWMANNHTATLKKIDRGIEKTKEYDKLLRG